MEDATLSWQYNSQQQRQMYNKGRGNVDQFDRNYSQRQQEQEDLAKDINDIELERAFDLNALERRLSYCFGQMRSHFEGEYLCEKRGPKFGNYGSFLPVREHNSQTPKEQNSAGLVHNYNHQTTASEGAVEKSSRLAITDGAWRKDSIACRNSSLNDTTLHGFTEETLAIHDAKVDGKLPVEKKTTNGVKLCFKFGSDIISHQTNTEISTGLGLRNSSSTSLESLNKHQIATTRVESPPDMSPLSIIQLMTSYEVPGGSLLSPLPKILMEGQGKESMFSNVIKRAGKSHVKKACQANSIAFECGKVIQAPTPRKETTANISESEKEQYSEFRCDKLKKVKTDMGTKFRVSKASLVSKDSSKISMKEMHQRKPDMVIAHNAKTNIQNITSLSLEERNVLANGKNSSVCLSKSENLEITAAPQHPCMPSKTVNGSMLGGANGPETETRKEKCHKHVVNVRKIDKSLNEVNELGFSGASTYKEKKVLDVENKGIPKENVLRRVATHEFLSTEHVKGMDMENKKTNGIHVNKKTMKQASKVVTKGNFKKTSIEKSAFSKGQKEQSKNNSREDIHGNIANCTNEQFVHKKEISMAFCKENTDQAKNKYFAREISIGIERGKRRDVANEHDLKKIEHASTVKGHDTKLLSEQAATQNTATNTSGLDDWVYCDACGKWRLCPIGLKIPLQQDNWLCHMMFWLPGMNHCNVPEEETTEVVERQNAISQAQILSETTQGEDQLPASISTAMLDPKSSNQIWPRSLQSSIKIVNNKKGLVQRSMPNVSGAVKFSNSFSGKDYYLPVKNRIDQYKSFMEQKESAVSFSRCKDGGKSNGVIKQRNKIKDKAILKETSGGEACEPEVNCAHTLNVKRKMDSELKECESAKKMKAKNHLVHDAKGVDVLPLKSEKTGNRFKIVTNAALAKENGVESLNGESKVEDQQQVTKKRKLMEQKKGKATHLGVVETNCMVDFEIGEEEGQSKRKRVKPLKTESIQRHASKGNKDEQKQKVKTVSSNVECFLHEIAEHSNQQSKERGLMQNFSDHNKPLEKESSCWPPFVSSTSNSSKLSCYTKSLHTTPERQGSAFECSVSSLPVTIVQAEKPSIFKHTNARNCDLIDFCNSRNPSPKAGITGDSLSDCSGFIMGAKDLFKSSGTSGRPSLDTLLFNGNQLEGSLIDASSGESSVVHKQSDASCKGTSGSQVKSSEWKGFVERDVEGTLVSSNREHKSYMANAALEEGKDLEQKADRIKSNGGDELEVIGFYFRASLKFLQSASILEPLSADSVRHWGNKSMPLFTYSAKLSKDCAKVYERNGKWAAAALAYQCTGFACMHVVMAKNLYLSRHRQELKSAAVMLPTGESPCSSASDVDNLNCHALTVVNQQKRVASLNASGNYVIDTQHCQHYNHLLQFVDDASAAFAAFAKAGSALDAASDSSYREHEISVVKKAINLNFHNLDGLLSLVIPLMESASLC